MIECKFEPFTERVYHQHDKSDNKSAVQVRPTHNQERSDPDPPCSMTAVTFDRGIPANHHCDGDQMGSCQPMDDTGDCSKDCEETGNCRIGSTPDHHMKKSGITNQKY